ncbi:CHAT domain-containing protein [Mycena venus]|uniref:CHAT domain-containing protein n=1 Tax=Mycena venus TaxID=2733690 RepID=A0A8H6XFT3_9AGAR|nr:CHAT domain-containing protein [Mycena venus]
MQSVYAYEDAVRDDPGKLKYLQDLVSALYQRFNQCGSVSDINKAGLLLKDALCLAAHDDPHRSTIVEDLGTVLAARFHHLSDLGDINEYVSILEAAVHLTPDDHPTKYSMLNNLGGVLQGRFRRLGDLKDLDQSIFALEEAVHLTPDDHPDKPLMLTNLASSLDARFGRRGDLRDINQAISKQEDAFHMIPDGHPEWSGLLANLGTFRLHRFEQTGSLSGVHEGISKLKDAVSLTPDDHPEKPARLNNLGTFLGARFKRLGDLKDLHECISMLEEAVQLTPAGLPARFGHLTNLGTFLLCRFDQTGDLSDLNEGISKHKDAVSLIPDGHSERPNMLSNLAGSLSTRFTQVGDLNDLNECIAKMEEAVRLTPDGHPKKPDRLHNLGSTLQYRSERLGDLSDANDGIAMLQAAVQLMPEGHPDRHSKLNNLGQALQRRFHQLGDLRDINESISTLEEAICTTPDDHPDKPLRLTTLATSLVARFERLSDPRDINQSISNHEGAISLTPDGHPEVATRLANLGVSLLSRFQQFNDPNDIQESLCHFTAAACSATGQVNVRLKAAQLWANCAHKLQHTSLLEAFQVALNLLPEVAWLGLSISDRHHQIMRAGLLVGDAAWTAISAGKPERAVEWLEQGRSIIWGQLLSLRTPVDALRQEWPDLADELISLSGQLDEATTRKNDAPWVDSGDQQSLMSMADQAHKNAQKRSALVKKIQQLPGFQQFLLPKTISQLSSAAQKGPVVILNVSQTSCDGLILWKELSKEVIHVPLPKFTAENVKYLTQWLKDLVPSGGRGEVDRLYAAREEGYPDLEEEFAQILSELWVRLVKPILDALAITTPATDKLPRIWWCPTGPLTLLPIHAAGVYVKSASVEISLHEVKAQINVLLAGYETTAISLTWALIELSRNPAMQIRLREELFQSGGDPTWEELTNHGSFLDAVTCEILRLHPPVPEVRRMAAEDDILPLSAPIETADGKLIDTVFVHKGTGVMLHITCINRSEAFWGSNAKEFNPARWFGDKKHRAQELQGYRHLLTFSDGPHVSREEKLLRSSYSDTKLHDVMLAKVFARRWMDVSSFSADPGWVPTKMGGRSAPGNIDHAVDTFVMAALGEGKATPTKTGAYLKDSSVHEPNAVAKDEGLQDSLVKELERISGVKIPE